MEADFNQRRKIFTDGFRRALGAVGAEARGPTDEELRLPLSADTWLLPFENVRTERALMFAGHTTVKDVLEVIEGAEKVPGIGESSATDIRDALRRAGYLSTE